MKFKKIKYCVACLFLMIYGNSLMAQENTDLENGRKIFLRCKICHSLDDARSSKVGPNLNNLMGRKAGSISDYDNYSKALKESGLIWTEENLDLWFKNPMGFLPGNKMVFPGINKPENRHNLIEYLKSKTK